jgi:hypothetical protein
MSDLTSCEFCGTDVNPEAAFCPGCGVPGPGSTPKQRNEWVQRMGGAPRRDGGALALKERSTETVSEHRLSPTVQEREGAPPEIIVERTGNGLAVAALVLGIVGVFLGIVPILFFLSLPCGILALVFGVVGRRKAQVDERRGGKGMAVAGVILGCLTVVLGIAGIVIVDDAVNDLEDELNELDAEIESFDEEFNVG